MTVRSSSEAPPNKLRRTCSVVVDQADDTKVLVDNTLASEPITVEVLHYSLLFSKQCNTLNDDLIY